PYAGCRPVFAAPDLPPGDVVLVGWPSTGPAAFAKMDDGFFRAGDPVRMVCAVPPAPTNSLCERAREAGTCRAQGTKATLCVVPADKRAELRKLL
ncbi:MAG TPA: hypothetical protein VIM73_02280, partial [Polyangiaceae bacterium]